MEGARMIAYKFLAQGRVGPVSGAAWPEPGVWLEVPGELAACARGVHVCRTQDLAHWLSDELWELETHGDSLPGTDCLVVPKARLVRCVEAWTAGGAARFAAACAEHAASGSVASTLALEFVSDSKLAGAAGYYAASAYCAALAVTKNGPPEQAERAYRDERAWQSAWIARELL
jgi:hypothetical protein